MAVESKTQSKDKGYEVPNINRLTESGLEKRLRIQKIGLAVLFVFSILTIVILAATLIVMVLFSKDLYKYPDVIIEMFTTVQFKPSIVDSSLYADKQNQWGILSMIFGTFYIGIMALSFAMFFGFGTALFLSEYTPKNLARKIQPILEFIAALPSIILALIAVRTLSKVIGWLFLHKWFINFTASLGWNHGKGLIASSPTSKLATAFMVAVLAAPIIASISFDAMQSTPATQRQAAKAFGATKQEVFFTVVLPHASKSMFASVLLGFGRVIGETMIATVVLGSNPIIDWDPFANGITMTSVIVQYLGEASAVSDLRDTLFFIGLMLLLISFVVVALSEAIVNKNKYVMSVINFLWKPFGFISGNISKYLNRFAKRKQISDEQIISQQSNRFRKNLFIMILTGSITIFFIGSVFALLSTVFAEAWHYFTLNGTIGSFFNRWVVFLTKRPSYSLTQSYQYGIYPAIIGSLLVILVSSVIAFPIATATAIWLYEFADEGRISNSIRQAIVNISAMPSIVVGIFVYAVFSVGLRWDLGILPGAIALGIMMIPIVTTNAIEALRNIPKAHRESALALGATRWEAFWKHRFPYAFPSILTGYILGLARVIGETAPIFFTAAVVTGIVYPNRLIDQGVRMLPFEIYFNLKVSTTKGPDGTRFGHTIASAVAVVLLLIVALLNILAYIIRRKWRARYEYNGEL